MTSLKSAAEYHSRTKYTRQGRLGGGMDPKNRPSPDKIYPGAQSVALSRDLVLPRAEARPALRGDLVRPPQSLNLASLAGLLFMAYGFTDRVELGSEVFLYRSAPSAGALYPTEVYLAAQGIEGLDDGLYHYSLTDFALTRLRQGAPPAGVPAPALILTGLFFRSAWKYLDRAFRYCLLDTGHVAENITLAGPVLGLDTMFTSTFDDDLITGYLGLDRDREAPLGLVRLGPAPKGPAKTSPLTDPPASEPIARREDVFDLVASVARLTAAPPAQAQGIDLAWPQGAPIDLPVPDWAGFEGPTLVQVLQKRRSRRNFKPKTVPRNELARFLDLVVPPGLEDLRINIGFLTNEIQDLADGFYHFRLKDRGIERHKGGFLGPGLALSAFSQDWLGRANLTLVLTAPLKRLEETLGPRALRLAYLDAGRIGQRAYLAAEAFGWGCCGVGAFFDDDVHQYLDIPPGEEVLYLIPSGPIKKRTHGGRPDNRLI